MHTNIILETDRLIIRPFCEADVDAVYAFNSNVEMHRYTGDKITSSKAEALDIIQNIWLAEYKKYGYARWAVIHKADNKMIGFAGFKYLAELDETDIGYRYLPAYWGKGIATEAIQALIPYGLNVLKLKRIIGIAMPENVASCKVLEKGGLTFYKQAKFLDEEPLCNWYEL